jgi:hypothetical protein
MPKSRHRDAEDDDIPSAQRSQTQFSKANREKFNRAIAGLDQVMIYMIMTRFERAYRASTSHADIAGGFQTDHLGSVAGCYRVYEVYAGLDARVAVMFLQRKPLAYWLHP